MAPLLHPIGDNVRPQPVHFSKEYLHRTLTEDREIIERIIAAYHHAVATASPEDQKAMFGVIWSDTGHVGKQGSLVQALNDRSCAGVHDILRQYFISDAAHGIALGRREMEVVFGQEEHRRYQGLVWLDRLVGLARAVGAMPIPNPEDNGERWKKSLEVDAEQVFTAIENQIGLKLRFPNISGVFGGEIRHEAFPFIAFTHLLVALNLQMLVRRENPTIFEIGGGFGGLAYFTTQLLPCRYTIFDLPFTNAAQAYFLNRALPNRKLTLCGESGGEPGAIALQPGWALFHQPPGTNVDVVVNQDAMPEMPGKTVSRYLEAMKTFLNGPFLSVNQEPAPDMLELHGRTSVQQLVGGVGGYVRTSRSPFFLRLGYVQEVYYPAHLLRPAKPPVGMLQSAKPPFKLMQSVKTAFRLMTKGDVAGLHNRLRSRLTHLFHSFL